MTSSLMNGKFICGSKGWTGYTQPTNVMKPIHLLLMPHRIAIFHSAQVVSAGVHSGFFWRYICPMLPIRNYCPIARHIVQLCISPLLCICREALHVCKSVASVNGARISREFVSLAPVLCQSCVTPSPGDTRGICCVNSLHREQYFFCEKRTSL